MKKFLCSLIVIVIAAFCFHFQAAALEKRVITLGFLEKLNSTEEFFAQEWQKSFAPNNELLEVRVKFYPNLNALQMALNAGEIQHIVLPDVTAEYLMNQNPEYESVLVLHSSGMGLAFGFSAENQELRQKFSEAIITLKNNWTLPAIEGMYLTSSGKNAPKPVEFAHFDGAPVIRAAVTGDIPPVDFMADDGTPAGFSTAVLAEIGKLLGVNIELMNVESAARSSALASGRADVVFWYEVVKGADNQPDIPEGVIVSEPYYEWEKFIHIKKKPAKDNSWGWNIFNRDFMDFYIHN